MNLSDTIQELKRQLEDYEGRVKTLEQKLCDAQEETKKATALRDGKYDEVLKSIFEKPKNELAQHIKKQSTSSIRNTWIAAILALILSIAIGMYFQIKTNSDIFEYRKELKTLGDLIITQNTLIGDIQSEMALQQLEDFYVGFLEPEVRNYITKYGPIETRKDLSLLYKTVVTGFPVAHVMLAGILKRTGISSGIYSLDDFSKWDKQILTLYSSWLKETKTFESDVPVKPGHKYFKNFSSSDDGTNYGDLYLKAENYGELRQILSDRIEAVTTTIERNKMIKSNNKMHRTR